MKDKTNMQTLKYTKVRKVKSPVRAHPEDAGIDLYFPSEITEDEFTKKCDITKCNVKYTLSDDSYIKDITLCPGQSVLLPCGLKVKIPHGHALILFNKSGVASKKHLHVGACVIDENYQGECNINVTNVGDCNITISAEEKLVQGILIPVNYAQLEEVDTLDELYADGVSDRGTGGFGSTGTK